MGGVYSAPRSGLPMLRRFRPIPSLFTVLRTLLHCAKAQLFSFQSFPHSLPKTTRGGGRYGPLMGTPTIARTGPLGFTYLWIGPMRRRLIRIALILLFFPPLLAAVAGWLSGPAFLHPIRRELTPDLIREADASFAVTGSTREDFDVRAPDGVLLRGWKVRPKNPNGSWVLLFHGVADNRIGVVRQSEFLLRAGYGVVMMDARAHGASGGPIATYGWLERNDTHAMIDALLSDSSVNRVQPSRVGPSSSFTSSISSTSLTSSFHLFALGESMGAGIVLQSAAADPRIEAVVAEASFANMREASYDYAGLRKYPWLGKTLLAPFSWTLLYRGEKLAGFPVAEVSPQKAVAARAFPVLLICDEKDVALPCRHSEMIFAAASSRSLRRTPVCPSSKQLARGLRFADTRINFLFQVYAGENLRGQVQPCLVCPISNFTLPISALLRSVHGMLPRFPLLAQPPHRLPQAHGQRGNRFEPLLSAARELAVIFPVNLGQQQFRVSQNSGQRVVQLMAEHLSKIFFRFLERTARAVRHSLGLAQAAPDQAKRRRQASSIAHHIIRRARIDQRRELHAPLRSPNHHHRRIDRQRGHHRVEPRHDPLRSIGFRQDRGLFQKDHRRRIFLKDSPRGGNTIHGRHAQSRDTLFEFPPRRRAQRCIVTHYQYGLFAVTHGLIHF